MGVGHAWSTFYVCFKSQLRAWVQVEGKEEQSIPGGENQETWASSVNAVLQQDVNIQFLSSNYKNNPYPVLIVGQQ